MDIGNLSHLLEESRSAQEKREGSTQPPIATAPSSIKVNRDQAGNGVASNQQKEVKGKDDSKAIWNIDEIPTEDALATMNDDRPCPRYEISYKQSVGKNAFPFFRCI